MSDSVTKEEFDKAIKDLLADFKSDIEPLKQAINTLTDHLKIERALNEKLRVENEELRKQLNDIWEKTQPIVPAPFPTIPSIPTPYPEYPGWPYKPVYPYQPYPSYPFEYPYAPGPTSICGKCGVDFSNNMGYVCGSVDCPSQFRVTCYADSKGNSNTNDDNNGT